MSAALSPTVGLPASAAFQGPGHPHCSSSRELDADTAPRRVAGGLQTTLGQGSPDSPLSVQNPEVVRDQPTAGLEEAGAVFVEQMFISHFLCQTGN